MLNAFPSQASSPKDEDPTMSLGACFSAEPLSIWTFFFLVRVFLGKIFLCCLLWLLPLVFCCAPLSKFASIFPGNPPHLGTCRKHLGLPVSSAPSSPGWTNLLCLFVQQATERKAPNCWQIHKSCLFYWNRLVPSYWQGKDCVCQAVSWQADTYSLAVVTAQLCKHIWCWQKALPEPC